MNLLLTSAWALRPQTAHSVPNARPSTSLASVLLGMSDRAFASGHLVQACSWWRQGRRPAVREKRTSSRQTHPPRVQSEPGTAGGPKHPLAPPCQPAEVTARSRHSESSTELSCYFFLSNNHRALNKENERSQKIKNWKENHFLPGRKPPGCSCGYRGGDHPGRKQRPCWDRRGIIQESDKALKTDTRTHTHACTCYALFLAARVENSS